jgi:hypothetical protein
MRRSLTLALISIFLTSTPAFAQECDGEKCISVTADDENHVVITVKKGEPGSSATTSPSPRPIPMPTPKPSATLKQTWIPWLPKPVTTAKAVTQPRVKRSYKPRPRKPKVKKISAVELADQVKKMLPNGTIITQPTSAALLREPVNFITTLPATFQTVIVVLEVPILITLKARYEWDFGDGNSQISTLPGAPYPAMLINHRYLEPGDYEVELEVIWSGTWRAGALAGPINGTIKQSFSRDLKIYTADTVFTK